MGRGNRTAAGTQARNLLYGPRKIGSRPVEIKPSFADCIDSLDNSHLPLSFASCGLSIASPAKVHSGPSGLTEGERVHQYFLNGLDNNGNTAELAFVRDNGRNYLSLSYEFDLAPGEYSEGYMPASGGDGEKRLLARLARDFASDDIMVEFIALNGPQVKGILANYPVEKMAFGATSFGQEQNQAERLAHLIDKSLFDLDEEDHEVLEQFDNLPDLAAKEPELLMRMAEETTIYMEIPLNDLAQEMGWLADEEIK